jgi:hypothetical protein
MGQRDRAGVCVLVSRGEGGKWIVENHGVDPDYLVEQRPDLEVAGHDPQLERAVEIILDELKEYPGRPVSPKYPDKMRVKEVTTGR